MAIQTRTQLKRWFETNDVPTEVQFGHWIDSFFHSTEDSLGSGDVTAAGGAANYTPSAATVLGHLAGIDTALGVGGVADDAITNAKLANMAAWTLKLRNNAALGDPQDVLISSLTEEASPASGDWLIGELSTGELRKFDVGNLPGGGGSGAFSDAGDPVVLNTTTKDVVVGAAAINSAKFSIDGDADQVQLALQGHSAQTANLLELEETGGAVVFSVSAAGLVTLASTIDGRDLATDGTKLDGIEALADVTDATNVAAAGAVMDGDFGVAGVCVSTDGAGTYTNRTLTGTANEVTITNGDGVAGNPTFSLPAVIDLGGKTSLEIPNSATPTVNADGEIALDTTVTDFSHGILKYYGGEELAVVALPIAELTTPTDTHVVAYNATNDEFELVAPAAGGSGAFSDAGDPVILNTTTKDVVVGAALVNGGKLSVDGDADQVQFAIGAHADQTSNIVEIEDSGAVIIFSINDQGDLVVNGTVDGRDVATDGTKLDGIEALADVTDATNVAAAGAVMDGDFSTNGLMIRTGVGTYTNRTITGTSNEIDITNGDGVSGNPTLALSDTVDLSANTSLAIPTSATPTVDANGEIALDTTVTDWSHGIIRYFGGEEMFLVAMPVAQLTTPSDGFVVKYNATNDEFELASDVGGGTGAYSDAGDPVILNTTTKDVIIAGAAQINTAKASIDGDADQVQLAIQANGTQTTNILEIEDTGAAVIFSVNNSGNLALSGTVDGRDVAADGTKLDGIEALADVTDATNVNAAGAIMHSDISGNGMLARTAAETYTNRTITGTAEEITVTNGDGVAGNPTLSLPATITLDAKELRTTGTNDLDLHSNRHLLIELGDAAGANYIQVNDSATVEVLRIDSDGNLTLSGTVDGRDVAADGTKLDGVEALADVTDATNVNAAGAIMHSDIGGNGMLARTAAETYINRTITGTTNEIDITNGDGVSGNPTLAISATLDLSGNTSLAIPVSATPTVDSNGEIALDTTVTDFSHGIIRYFGGEEMFLVAMPVAQLTTPTNGHVVAYNSTNDEFELVAQGAGTGAYSDAGDPVLLNTTTKDVIIAGAAQINTAKASIDGDADQVQLAIQANGTQTTNILEIEDTGAAVIFSINNSGNVTLSGTVDGRDIDADGTKLDGIEALADVTDATNVNAAGAIMHSDIGGNGMLARTAAETYINRTITGTAEEITVSNGDGVSGNPTLSLPATITLDAKELRTTGVNDLDLHSNRHVLIELGDAAGANYIQVNDSATVEVLRIDSDGNLTLSGTVDGRDVDADGTKLDGVEALADVTDATNVAAAGAVMDGDFSTNGVMIRTGAGVYTNRTITGTANEITVSDGDGVSGNPTISIPAVINLGGKTSLEIPNSATPSVTVDGQIALDTTVTDWSHGILRYFGGEEMFVVAMPVAQLLTPGDGEVVKYNATNDEFELGTVGGSGAYSDAGDPVLLNTTTKDVIIAGAAQINTAKASIDGDTDQVQLAIQANGTQTANILEIEDTGAAVIFSIANSGNVAVSGTVDGRDLDADGTKLDGIEALADVTDATNVNAAGAIMHSDIGGNGILARTAAETYINRTITGTAEEITVTNGDGVSGNPTLSLPATITLDAKELRTTGTNDLDLHSNRHVLIELGDAAGANYIQVNDSATLEVLRIDSDGNLTLSGTVDGRDIDADGTKLDGVEALADVTDATNVAAAGAVMDGDFSTNGLMVRTSAGAYTSRTITGTTNKIDVSNGDGVSANPTLTLSDTVDLSAHSSFALPVSATPTVNSNGEIALDTTVTDWSHGILRYFGTEEMFIVAMPVAQLVSPTDQYVVKYIAASDEFQLAADAGGGSGAYSDAGDPVLLNSTGKDVIIAGPAQINSAKASIDGDADQVQFSIQGNATQTTNLIEIEQSGGTVVMSLANDGELTLDNELSLDEMTAPTGTANEAKIFAEDDGSGDTRLMAIFGTGAKQRIAGEDELNEAIIIAVSDETSDLTTGTAKVTFRMPYAFTLIDVRTSVTTAPVGGGVTVDINEGGASVLSTRVFIDASDTTSEDSITQPVISDSALAFDASMTIDIDAVGSSTAGAGLKVYLIGHHT